MHYICIYICITQTSVWVKNSNEKAKIPNELKITLLEKTKLKELISYTGQFNYIACPRSISLPMAPHVLL